MQIYDKYCTMARDANSAGDRVAAENYLQHAEHYFRIMTANAQNGGPRPTQHLQHGEQGEQDDEDDNIPGAGPQPDTGDMAPQQAQSAPQPQQPNQQQPGGGEGRQGGRRGRGRRGNGAQRGGGESEGGSDYQASGQDGDDNASGGDSDETQATGE